MSGVKVLLVEGRRTKTTTLAPAIRKVGYLVDVVHTGQEVFTSATESLPSVIVFDTSAMRSNGVRSCRRIRSRWPDLPVIHCRAQSAELDESAGADVYIEHPFTSRKIINRIRKLLPASDSEDQIHRLGDITLYRGAKAVHVAGLGEFSLTPKLLGLLELFMRHPDEVIGRKQLMKEVWNTDYVGDTRTLDVHIRWLRERLEIDAAKPKRLCTRRGKGYILVSEES